MILIDTLSAACPLLLCSMGALFSEYAGILAIFLEGLISFSAYLMYFYSTLFGSAILGFIFTSFTSVIMILFFSFIIEKTKANPFIAATAINLFFSALPSFFSSVTYGTRGVLYNESFVFNPLYSKIITIGVTSVFLVGAYLFLKKTKYGLYLRITGTDSDVLIAKGVNPLICRVGAWCASALFASVAGAFLAVRVASFVPNISSGRGWMALAAVYLGRKKTWRVVVAVLIFCIADIFSITIQNYINIPSAVLLSFPYLVVLVLIAVEKK